MVRNLLSVSLVLLWFVGPAFGQPRRKDNVIKITESVPDSKIKAVLFMQGYILEPSTDTVLISTKSKDFGSGGLSIKLSLFKEDSVTYLRGYVRSNIQISNAGFVTENDFAPISFDGRRKLILGSPWGDLEKIAHLLSSASVEYLHR